MKDGFISVQAEGSTTQFRKIEVLDLVGCMDKTKPGYKSYFVKSDPTLCNVVALSSNVKVSYAPYTFRRMNQNLSVSGSGILSGELMNIKGARLSIQQGTQTGVEFLVPKSDVYLVRIKSISG